MSYCVVSEKSYGRKKGCPHERKTDGEGMGVWPGKRAWRNRGVFVLQQVLSHGHVHLALQSLLSSSKLSPATFKMPRKRACRITLRRRNPKSPRLGKMPRKRTRRPAQKSPFLKLPMELLQLILSTHPRGCRWKAASLPSPGFDLAGTDLPANASCCPECPLPQDSCRHDARYERPPRPLRLPGMPLSAFCLPRHPTL